MRQTRGWNGFRTAVVALGIAASAASGADAAALITYSTVGSTIDSTGVTGIGAISLNTVNSGLFSNPSSFSLGEFQVAELPEGTSTTYVNTPFSFTFQSKTIDGVEPVPNGTPISIKGVLNGTVTGGNQSSVVATFDPTPIPELQDRALRQHADHPRHEPDARPLDVQRRADHRAGVPARHPRQRRADPRADDDRALPDHPGRTGPSPPVPRRAGRLRASR